MQENCGCTVAGVSAWIFLSALCNKRFGPLALVSGGTPMVVLNKLILPTPILNFSFCPNAVPNGRCSCAFVLCSEGTCHAESHHPDVWRNVFYILKTPHGNRRWKAPFEASQTILRNSSLTDPFSTRQTLHMYA